MADQAEEVHKEVIEEEEQEDVPALEDRQDPEVKQEKEQEKAVEEQKKEEPSSSSSSSSPAESGAPSKDPAAAQNAVEGAPQAEKKQTPPPTLEKSESGGISKFSKAFSDFFVMRPTDPSKGPKSSSGASTNLQAPSTNPSPALTRTLSRESSGLGQSAGRILFTPSVDPEAVSLLTKGLLGNFSESVNAVETRVLELLKGQYELLELIHQQNVKVQQIQLSEASQTIAKVPEYIKKVQSIKKNMNDISTKMDKLKTKAEALKQRKLKDDADEIKRKDAERIKWETPQLFAISAKDEEEEEEEESGGYDCD
eukprot:TRINITY_DN4292_c2_g1_i1.p1 TRINITY_DN4292_c2_g1~~TRINITY_DN4292_c2_g1_i1.p1  ORF type:complete len:319 (+),score=159.90 TRINITY_DN4292_c2_g1_i1:26-958(+)